MSTTQPRAAGTTIHPDHTPSTPEQIRTNLNKSERRRTPRPDRNTPSDHPESARSKKPEQARAPSVIPAPLSVIPAQAGTHPPRATGTTIHAGSPPNKPEQIRTNLNKPERRRTLRPDRNTLRITQNPPDQKNPNKPSPATGISPKFNAANSSLPLRERRNRNREKRGTDGGAIAARRRLRRRRWTRRRR